MMDANHKQWNTRQQELRAALKRPAEHRAAIELFLAQHAAVHASAVSGMREWSFEEEIWQGLSDAQARRISDEHSIAWITWHLARIEDMTMNTLVGGTPQVFDAQWQARLCVTDCDTGNRMPLERVAALSARVDLQALRAYRCAVGSRTRALARTLTPDMLRRKPAPQRIEALRAAGHVLPEAADLLDYWGGLTIAGLLLMPPTRHCFLHLNEAKRIKAAFQ